MRIGLVLPSGDEAAAAHRAERHGLFGVLVEGTSPGAEAVVAGLVAPVTASVRILLRVPLGSEHPVTLAEEVSVLDNASGGRVVVVADTADLDAEAAVEDLELLRRALSARPVRHVGARWRFPAALHPDVPERLTVTPEPAQVAVPVWLTGEAGASVAARTGLPHVAQDPASCSSADFVQPGVTTLSGHLDADRDFVLRWAAAGATHLLVRLPAGQRIEDVLGLVSRYLQPEVSMPSFPRIIAESKPPDPWRHGIATT